MQITLTTPALLFPAISLLLLAYTNRFLAIATLIRQLHKSYLDNAESVVEGQLKNLRKKTLPDKSNAVVWSVESTFVCTCNVFYLPQSRRVGSVIFGVSLVLLLLSFIYFP